ncbi:MAG: hypothetical protein ABSF88_03745 [Candidatus Aminicenantales bacterium]
MCRFLMVKSPSPFPIGEILERFAEMAEKSRAPDGDRQADGWGAGWLDKRGNWQIRKSIRPVWEEIGASSGIPQSRIFLIHARSASFPGHKEVVAYNQPFVSDAFAFVFNGFLRGVSFPFPVKGDIGAQKIWTLLSGLMETVDPETGLARLTELLNRNTRRIQALNIGICDKNHLFASCRYVGDEPYYQLYYHNAPALSMICSEPLMGFPFSPLPRQRVFKL